MTLFLTSHMRDYFYYKFNIILRKNRQIYYVFNANVSLSTRRSESDVISY